MRFYFKIMLVLYSMAIILNMAGETLISEPILFFISGVGVGTILLLLYCKEEFISILGDKND